MATPTSNLDFDITTSQYGRKHDHGEIRVSPSPDGLEYALDVDVNLVVAGEPERPPSEVAEEFAHRLNRLVEEYAI